MPGCGPLQEGVSETVPRWDIVIPRGAPPYRLRTITVPTESEGTLYDRFYRDPRLFFVGAPSSLESRHPFAAEILQRARNAAIRDGTQRHVEITPLGVGRIERRETLALPDGRQYSLTATWSAPASFTSKRSVKTQTGAATQTSAADDSV